MLVLHEWVHAPVLGNLQGGIKLKCGIGCTEIWAVFYAIAVSDTDISLFVIWEGLEVFKVVL